MFNLMRFLNTPVGYYSYMWVEVTLLKETKKAILVEFDGKRAWFSKAWIIKTLRKKRHCEPRTIPVRGEAISLLISEYHWAKKF